MTANRLIHEKSPYLLQHAHNPVDWRPWGEEAFRAARERDLPIFLSVGYSTCHWCHVMERESFENPAVAELLNRFFVPIKVDREERPDVDRLYMLFVQATTGSGGWPMSVWLTPDLKPFYGGTYFPPDARYGRPGFGQILEQIAERWSTQRDDLVASAGRILGELDRHASTGYAPAPLHPDALDACCEALRRGFDSTRGGFGGAPKFPRPVVLNFLFRHYHRTGNADARDMGLLTLREMAKGGMHDQLGGGFHRYSVDESWFVPHFEKMLYDQAQVACTALDASRATGSELPAWLARSALDYVLRDMADDQGGFHSAEDADSPLPDGSGKAEGAYYVWSLAELGRVLGPDAAFFADHYGMKEGGNVARERDPHGEFSGKNVIAQVRPFAATARLHGLGEQQANDLLVSCIGRLRAAR
ncbi:MAG: thioredoxin domain-containing protein [Bryobacteraceae bacterium]